MSLFLSVLAATLATAPNPPTADPLVTEFHFERLETFKDGSLSSGGLWMSKWNDWLKVEQLPASVRDTSSEGRAILRMSIDASGRLTGCDAVGQQNAEVSKAVCQALSTDQHFPITYSAPGQPSAEEWTMALVWQTLPQSVADARKAEEARRGRPPPPPAPPWMSGGTWPPLFPPHAVSVASLPDIKIFAPKSGRGRVGVFAKAVVEREQPDCEIGLSSGNALLDDAACRYVRSVRLAYKSACFDCYPHLAYPLLIEFDGSRSTIHLPRDDIPLGSQRPKLIALEASRADISALKKSQLTRSRVTVVGKVSADGSLIECSVSPTAGSQEADNAICAMVGRQTFTPAVDAFGNPTAGEFFQGLDLSQL